MPSDNTKLFKSHGVLWRISINQRGNEFVEQYPLCPTTGCRAVLEVKQKPRQEGVVQSGSLEEYHCVSCDKTYPCSKGDFQTRHEVDRKWEGFKVRDAAIYSLDLPPTKVMNESEDENYWVQARISEKDGKRMAVIYFGEKIHGQQNKSDYSQIFVDFDEEQMRFDKTNKNPLKILAKLTAEFPNSKHESTKKVK